jgi:iron complex transport system substrate-binding protein
VKLRIVAALGAMALAVLTGPALAETSVVDADGRTVVISDTSRIVSVGGDITEILYALGAEDRVIAVDSTSLFPSRALAEKQVVGYMRAISPEGVLAASPSVVIAVQGSGPKEAIEVLEKASVPFVLVPEARNEAGLLAKIRLVAKVIGDEARGEQLAAEVAEDFAALAEIRERIAERRRAIFVLSLGAGAPMVGGKDTAADAVFALAGVDNALPDVPGYKPASEEAAMAANPDAVVIMSERGTGHTAADVFALPAFAGTPAAEAGRLVSMSGAYLLAFGPRLPHAARDLAAAIYPERDLPPLPPRSYTVDAAPQQ